MLVLILTFFTGVASAATCDARFFEDLQSEVALHICQLSVHPSCQPQQVSWLDDKSLVAAYAGGSAAAVKAATTSVQRYGAMHRAGTRAFAAKLGTDSFFTERIAGHRTFERTVVTPLSQVQIIRDITTRFALSLSAFSYINNAPERCNATIEGSAKTQKIEGGRCVDRLAYSSNLQKFLLRPPEEQVKMAQQFPSVCEFYQNFRQKIIEDMNVKAQLLSFECKGDLPIRFKAEVDGVTHQYTLRTNNDGLLTGFETEPLAGKSDRYAAQFRNGEEIETISAQSPPRPAVHRNMNEFRRLTSEFTHKSKPILNVFKVWWSGSVIVAECCRNPHTPSCRRGLGNGNDRLIRPANSVD